jgi:hypothetical protein
MRLGACALLLALVAASPETRYFRYERPIQTMPDRSGQTCLALDAGIFAHALPQLADLRLYHDGAETPYTIRVATPAEGAEKSIALLNAGVQGGQTVFDAELPDTHYSDLQLDVTAHDFIATVTVSGSRTKAGSAKTNLGAYTIFDLTRQKLGRSTVLHVPESDFPYLHFRVAGPLSPENITGLSVERLPASQPRFETVAESSQVTQKDHWSILEFTVPAHVPIERIAFAPGAVPALFSRDVNVSVAAVVPPQETDGAEPPQPVTSSGSLLRVHGAQNGHRIDEERLAIEAPAVNFDTPAKWTVAIENGDDAPLTLESVRLQMLQRSLCFEAAPNTRYMLFYGDPALAAPRYDYAKLFTLQADASTATAGPEQPNPIYEPRPDVRPFTEKHPALLWMVLIAVIALLGGIALRSARRPPQTLS